MLHVGHHWPSGQEQVCYVGEGGSDDGEWHWCSVADFSTKFLAVDDAVTKPKLPALAPAPAAPLDPLATLRALAQAAADLWHEPALLIVEPPAMPISASVRHWPYAILLSQSEPQERAAPHERIEPRSSP